MTLVRSHRGRVTDRWTLPDDGFDPTALPTVVTWNQALRLGYSRSAIQHRRRTGRWRRVLPQVYVTGGPLDERTRYIAALAYAGDGAMLSGAAALRCTSIVRVAAPREVLVLVPPANRSATTGWVRVRRSHRPVEAELALGPRRALLPRAVADHALTLHRLDDVRAVVAQVVSGSGCSVADLVDELEAGPRQGSALLRQVLAEVGPSRSAPEVRAAAALRRGGCGGFVQNARIALPRGSYYEADFLWPELRAILEIDSVEFHLGPAQWRATMDRHLALTTLGYAVVHRPPSALVDEASFLRDVQAWLAARRLELHA